MKSKQNSSTLSEHLSTAIKSLGFEETHPGRYTFSSTQEYELRIDARDGGVVDYGSEIRVHHKTACRLSKPEGLVVLHAVVCLLNRGYAPRRIELEKTWTLGHKEKGRLDILLTDPKGRTFAMIECKTWGQEYTEARNDMLEDGGQLFSYFVQDRATRSLYLYSSRFIDGKFNTLTEFLNTPCLSGNNLDEIYKSWDKSLFPVGIFDESSKLYGTLFQNLKAKDLKDLDRETGHGLFNSFAKILRRHTLSDKSNAFNRIFNLFVCKIADEDRSEGNDVLQFQWRVDDTVTALLARLHELYALGLKNYLDITIDSEFFFPQTEFAFVDIFDRPTFERNAAVLREVVQLLQGFRLRYTARHQFLGDFFEMLLNTGLKQEAGQFFTPVPLAKFILRSLPIDELILKKVQRGDENILPYTLDFACGSGHFLTSAIEEIDSASKRLDRQTLPRRTLSKLKAGDAAYLWTKEYLYGVDEDYRLAKTTKVATFMNGDGDATVIHGNALGSFHQSSAFRGRLRTDHPKYSNPSFDIIVSNPPFAVANFLANLPTAKSDFKLASLMTMESGDIECLFIERAAQLLQEGSVAGIIMPLSILSGTQQSYVAVRKIILTIFRLVGLVELRDKAFSASTSATVCIFLEKRQQSHIDQVAEAVQKSLLSSTEQALAELRSKVIAKFPELPQVCSEKVPLEVVPDLERAIAFVLNDGQTCVSSYSGDKREQESYLGYRFSSARGKEGIQLVQGNESGRSLLYSEDDYDDPSTVSTLIRQNFASPTLEIPESLGEQVKALTLNDIVDYDLYRIANPSSSFIRHAEVESNSPFGDFIDDVANRPLLLGSLIESGRVSIVKGLTYPKNCEVPYRTETEVLTADSLDLREGKIIPKKQRYLIKYSPDPAARPQAGDVVVSIASGSLNHLGKVAYVSSAQKAFIGGFLSILRAQDANLGKALFYNLLSERFRRFVALLKDQNINNLPPHELKKFTLLLPADLDSFVAIAETKERELLVATEQTASLRQSSRRGK